MGKTSEAIENIEKAIELNPNYAMAWFGLGNALQRTHSLDRALAAIDKAIALSPFDPFMPIFVFVRGSVLLWMGRYQEAVEDLERAIKLGKVPVWAYMQLAAAHQALGNTERARQVVAEFREKFPSSSISAFRNAARRLEGRFELVANSLRQLGVPEE
jgi:superkiller protein 3